jgi:hypothetical protein
VDLRAGLDTEARGVWTQRLEEKSLYHSKCARKFAGNFRQNSLCPGWYLNQRLADSKAGEPTAGNFTVRDLKACTTYTLAIYFILEEKIMREICLYCYL